MPVSTTASAIPTPATPDVCTAKILIENTEVPATIHILSLMVSREVNRIPTATLHIQDGSAPQGTFPVSNGDLFVPGRKIQIKLGYRSQEDLVFKGTIVKFSVKIRKNGSFLIVECRDEAVKMTACTKSRYHVDKKDSDIMEEIIGQYGLAKEVQATLPELRELVQFQSTDWDFVLCRAEANGLLVMVENGRIKIAKPNADQAPIVSAAFGTTILELDAEVDARNQSTGVKAFSWNAADQEVENAEAAEPVTTNNGNLQATTLANVMGGGPQELKHGGMLAAAELKAWADGNLLRQRFAKVRGRVRFQGLATVLPGKLIEVLGIGDRLQGKVLVTAVRHQFAGGNWETDVQFGLPTQGFAETFNLQPLPAAGLLPAVSGLQIGIVTKLEGDPGGEDRIKLRLPLVSTQEEGTWARIATLDAGDSRGTYFRPEIGDEVIVGFLSDDPRHPVVLGMCHSSKKPAPKPPSNNNHEKGYVSREKLALKFDDEKKIITIETPGGNKLVLSEDDKAINLQDQNGNKITLNSNGIVVESAKDLVLKASNIIKVEGGSIEMKAQSSLKAQASGTAEISSANTSVKGSAATVIQGGIVQIN